MTSRFIAALTLMLAAPTASGWAQTTPFPDTVLINGKIVTVDDTFSIAQAVAIRGERIVAVGDTKTVQRTAACVSSKRRTQEPRLVVLLSRNSFSRSSLSSCWRETRRSLIQE